MKRVYESATIKVLKFEFCPHCTREQKTVIYKVGSSCARCFLIAMEGRAVAGSVHKGG